MEWYLNVLKNYAVFSGRARRKEYWLFILIHSVIATGLVIVDFQLQLYFILYMSYALVMLVPCMSVMVRRLHDIGRSGWWFFVSFVPAVGPIVLLVFLCLEGDREANQYGPSPKHTAA